VIPDLLDPFRYRDGTAVCEDMPNEEHQDDASDQEVVEPAGSNFQAGRLLRRAGSEAIRVLA